MAALQRQRVEWNGLRGGAGVSTFFFTDAAAHQAALHALYVTMSDFIGGGPVFRIEPGGDTIESTTGALTGAWTGTVTGDIPTGTGGSYAPPSGFMVRWDTGGITGGRRLKGRTFFVPILTGSINGTGGIVVPDRIRMQNAVTTFVAAVPANLKVFQRPRLARPAFTDGSGKLHKAITARVGGFDAVTDGIVPDEIVVLRSRRHQ